MDEEKSRILLDINQQMLSLAEQLEHAYTKNTPAEVERLKSELINLHTKFTQSL